MMQQENLHEDRKGVAEPRALWLYGIIPSGQPIPKVNAISLIGIDHSTLTALVEEVPKAEFTNDALDQNMKSLDWVAGIARRHQTVIETAMKHGPVVPARLCTLFTDVNAVVAALDADVLRLRELLSCVAHCEEWGLKAYCDEDVLRARVASRHPELWGSEAAVASPGMAYVLARKRDERAAELALERMDEIAEELLDGIEPSVLDLRHKALPDSPADAGRSMVVNIALLMKRGQQHILHATLTMLADQLGEEGVSFELSGPWAPYSFCDPDKATAPTSHDAGELECS